MASFGMNMANFGILEGRLTRDPKIFTNKDGSRKVLVNIAVQDNFKSGEDKSYNSQFPQLEQFLNKDSKLQTYDKVKKGDLLQLRYSVRTPQYKKEDGSIEYQLKLVIEDVKIKAYAPANRLSKNEEAAADANAAVAEPQEELPFTAG